MLLLLLLLLLLFAAEALRVEGLPAGALNACGQHWNHSFFFAALGPQTLNPKPQTLNPKPLPKTLALLQRSFGGYEDFKRQFKAAAASEREA